MIRPTAATEIDELVALAQATGMFPPLEVVALREVFDDYFSEDHKFGHKCVTYDRDGELLGFAYYAPAEMTDRTWYLWWIAVQAAHQGNGIGGKLLQHVENDIRRLNGRVVFLETSSQPHYELTRRFYLKQGYELHATLDDYYTDGVGMVVFRKVMR